MLSTEISVPDLQVPFPEAISPHAEQIDRLSIDWLSRHRMLDRADQFARIEQARLGLLTARAYPLAPPETLQVIADWHIWLFALDDGYCDESDFGAQPVDMIQMAARLLRVVDAPDEAIPPGAGRCASGLRDVRQRLESQASRAQLERWTATVHDYLFGIVWEAANRSHRTIPSLGDYVPLRRLAGAVPTCLGLIDISLTSEIPADEWTDPRLQRLTRKAANLIAWDNDIFSYNKELSDHGALHNLVTVLANERQCAPQAAVDFAVAMHDAEVADFLRIESQITPTVSDVTRTYITGLKHWVRGFLDYAKESSRYA